MSIASVSSNSAKGLPPALRTAQAAIHYPEVQEMLRRLSEYNLGICMPHTHDHETGEFRPLPGGLMQVESGLEVSFRPVQEIAKQTDRFLPVGWFWHAGEVASIAACEMVSDDAPNNAKGFAKHKMAPSR